MHRSMMRVIVHLHEAQSWRGRSLTTALLEYLLYSQVQSAAVTREGAGVQPEMGTAEGARLHPLPEYPVQVEFVASAEQMQTLLPHLRAMAGSALIEVQPVEVASGDSGRWRPRSCRAVSGCVALSIWVGDGERWRHRSLHEALVESLREHGMGGATVLRAMAGYAGACQGHPLLIMAVERAERIHTWLPVLAEMAPQAVVILHEAEVWRYAGAEQREGEAA